MKTIVVLSDTHRNTAPLDKLARVLAELAFAHYPVRVDAGEGEREFGSFDEAKEYAESVLTA